jgi:alpha-D-xyloside xylohydrolase
MKAFALQLSMVGVLAGFVAAPMVPVIAQTVSSYTAQSDGALCVLSNSGRLKVQVCAPKIIRIVYTLGTTIPSPQGLVVSQTTFTPGPFTVTDNGTAIVVATPQCTTLVNKSNSLVSFKNPAGKTVCSETARGLYPVTKSSQAGDSGTLNFNSPTGEGVYGLGNLSAYAGNQGTGSYWLQNAPDQTGQLNIRSLSFDMHQSNWVDVIPFFMTTSGYGILMNFCCHATKTSPLNFTASFLNTSCWDYFFFYGPQFDTIMANSRTVTGQAPMLPKWAYGLWQCKNRYTSSSDIISAVTTYRQDNIPVDCVVQDWFWWTAIGSFTWTSSYTSPAPSSWISTIHSNNCHFVLSVWPQFASGTSYYNQLQGHILNVGCSSNVDADFFDSVTARVFWSGANAAGFSNGVDAWWCDATEPECSYLTNQTTNLGAIEGYANAFPLVEAKALYDGQTSVTKTKRVVNLTRSFWAGQYRYGSLYWNGDLSSDMGNVATTVSGGINSSMAGNPYWCSDIGGFSGSGNGSPSDETLARWFEAGTFFPIFRLHGSRNTEIYNMSTAVRPIATAFTDLRYRLMPYIYSLAWKVTNEGYTMTRALWYDFPGDANVINIANQYMFGPALLINTVGTTGATSRNVYLPAGTWYNFWTGTPTTSTGATVTGVSAPLSIIPVFAKAGAIIPMGPKIQYATQSVDPIELRVYPGADGNFTFYEDENDNYNYQSGSYATIPISYNNTTGKVIIGARNGSFPGMLKTRTFNVVFVTAGHGIADTVTSNPDCVISYDGTAIQGCPSGQVGICHQCEMDRVQKGGMMSTMKTAEEKVSFPPGYSGMQKEIAVYSFSGRLLAKAVFEKQWVSLQKDFGIATGLYIVKVRTLK